jgi:hypothetical protein
MHRKGVAYRNESNAHNEISWDKKDGKKLGKVYSTVQYVLYTPAHSCNNEYGIEAEFMNVQFLLRFLGIVFKVIRFKVSVNNVHITN